MQSIFLGGEAVLTLDGWTAPREIDTERLNRMFAPDSSPALGHPYVVAFQKAAKFYDAEILEQTVPEGEPGTVY